MGEDDDLARRAAGGDRRALTQLLERHTDRIHALCRRVIGSSDDALDAAQEAMIAVARGIGGFDGRSAFTTWLYRVVTNAALDELRRRRRRPLPVGDALPEPAAVPSALDERVGARLDVDAALGAIPEGTETGTHEKEIAAVLDLPPGTVRSRIARGRAALRELLGNPQAAGDRRSGGHD